MEPGMALCALALCALTLFSCAGNDRGTGTGGDGGNVIASMDLAGVPVVMFGGRVDGGDMLMSSPIPGATVEIMGVSPPNSTTTGSGGSYTLSGALDVTTFLRASANGFESGEIVFPGHADFAINLLLLPSMELQQSYAAVGLTPDPSKGRVIVTIVDNSSTNGYGATLSAAHDPSYAFQNFSTPMTSDTVLSTDDLIFPNVVAGTTTITPVPPSGKRCAPPFTDVYRVDPGTAIQVFFQCN